MEKELILSNSPIKGYTIHAYPLSIALNEEKCKPWFYSNYIQLVCDPDYIENFYDFNNLCSQDHTQAEYNYYKTMVL